MGKLVDIFRMIVISPELLVGLCVWFIYSIFEDASEFTFSILKSEQAWPIAAVLGIPVFLIIASYKLGSEILSPKGKRIVILEWPEYWRLKYRTVYCLIICFLSFIASLISYYVVHQNQSRYGAIVIVVAWAVAATSVSSLALAKWKAREIIGE